MKRLWKFNFCPFYVAFAPYIVLSLLIFGLIGCDESTPDSPKNGVLIDKPYNMECTDDLAPNSNSVRIVRCMNKEMVCYLLYQHAMNCFVINPDGSLK